VQSAWILLVLYAVFLCIWAYRFRLERRKDLKAAESQLSGTNAIKAGIVQAEGSAIDVADQRDAALEQQIKMQVQNGRAARDAQVLKEIIAEQQNALRTSAQGKHYG
jgi:hypothetical protein